MQNRKDSRRSCGSGPRLYLRVSSRRLATSPRLSEGGAKLDEATDSPASSSSYPPAYLSESSRGFPHIRAALYCCKSSSSSWEIRLCFSAWTPRVSMIIHNRYFIAFAAGIGFVYKARRIIYEKAYYKSFKSVPRGESSCCYISFETLYFAFFLLFVPLSRPA